MVAEVTAAGDLFGPDEEPGSQEPAGRTRPVSGGLQVRRFLPANREDALLLLGGLFITPAMARSNTVSVLPVIDGRPGIVEGGIRHDEVVLLADGRPERFPVLLELGSAPSVSRIAVTPGDIVRIVFRSDDEASAFRLRPVEECDPSGLAFSVEPGCFSLEGPARFTVHREVTARDAASALAASRVAAGLGALIRLAGSRPVLRPSILRFCGGAADQAGGGTFTVDEACTSLAAPSPEDDLPVVRLILEACLATERATGRHLADEIRKRTASLDPASAGIAGRWLQVVDDVLRGRLELDGQRLGDDGKGSAFLRGALLGLVSADEEAAASFLDSERPAGAYVCVIAAFITGLRTGLLAESWRRKSPHADVLGRACEAMLGFLGPDSTWARGLVRAAGSADGETVREQILVGEVPLAAWQTVVPARPDPLALEWQAALKSAGLDDTGPGPVPVSLIVRTGAGLAVEVVRRELDGTGFPALRHRIAAGAGLRRPREIEAAFAEGGTLWMPRRDPDDGWSLWCELPALPDAAAAALLWSALARSLAMCVRSAKPRAPRKPRAKRPPVSAQSPAVGEAGPPDPPASS